MKISWGKLTLSIAICEAAGIIGSIFTFSAIPIWYNSLVKPPFSPPNYLFGPVWTLLYFLMGLSLYLVWEKGINKKKVKEAIVLFGIHLVFNTAWSIVFFGFKNITLALLEITILWALIVLVIVRFSSIDKRASYLLIPYLAWVSFAAWLNYSLYFLNP